MWDFDWIYAHCGDNNDACEDYEIDVREYSTNDTTCDTLSDDLSTFAVYTGFCANNGNHSTMIGCYDYDGPAQKVWYYDINCTGYPDDIDFPDEECQCYDGYGCELTDILDDCPEMNSYDNCSFAVSEEGIAFGLDICYNKRMNGVESSFMIACVDQFLVTVYGWDDLDCSGGTGTLEYTMNVSVFEYGWEYAHCAVGEIDYDCVGYYTEYTTANDSNLTYCDTNYDDYQEVSVVIDYCIPINNYSVQLGCYQGNEAQKAYANSDCSGDPFYIGYPSQGCECDEYDGCSLTVIDICEDDYPANCSFAIVEEYVPIGLDFCYSEKDYNGSESSYFWECVDSSHINLYYYIGVDCNDDDLAFTLSDVSIYAFGDWVINHCAEVTPDESCLGSWTEYESNGTYYCDTWTDAYAQRSVALDICVSTYNNSMSVMYGCYDDYGEALRIWYNGNCSGEPDSLNYPSDYCECDYWSGDCSLTVIDICEDDILQPNCSYFVTDDGFTVCF